MSKTSEYIRIEWKKNDAVRDAGLCIPDTVEQYLNIMYGEDPVWQSLNVYRPKEAGKCTLPVIINVHGGGWAYGDKELYQFYCADLAEHGFAVVNFSYRLSPENKYPAQMEDLCTVIQWVQDHAREYGFDKDHLFAVGDSAGAHLLSLYCILCKNTDYAERVGLMAPQNGYPKAVCLNCGKYEMDSYVSDEEEDLASDLLEGSGFGREIVNVLDNLNGQFPPVYMMTASGDFLKEQTQTLAHAFMEQNIPFVYEYYHSDREALGHVFHLDFRLEKAKECNDRECAFFRQF